MIKEDRIHDIAEHITEAITGLTKLEAIGVLEAVKYRLLTN